MRRMSTLMFEVIIGMLQSNPDGLSSVQIYNNLVDHGRLSRQLPAISSIGSVLKGMSKVGVRNTGSTYERSNTSGVRKVSVWTLDINRYNQWRNENE
mgnify:FL=1